jgi:hypothetical protein
MDSDTTCHAQLGGAELPASIAVPALANEPVDGEGRSPDYQAGFVEGCHEVRLAVALAWLRQWIKRGGSVLRHHDGSFVVGWPDYWDSPQHETDVERYGGTIPEHAALMLVHRYDGAMQEWHDLRNAIPGLKEALRTIVTNNPAMGVSSWKAVRA